MEFIHYSSFLGELAWAIFIFSNILMHMAFSSVFASFYYITVVCSIICWIWRHIFYVFTALKPNFTNSKPSFLSPLFIAAPELTCSTGTFSPNLTYWVSPSLWSRRMIETFQMAKKEPKMYRINCILEALVFFTLWEFYALLLAPIICTPSFSAIFNISC